VTEVVDQLRAAAAEVCRRARHVRIDGDRIHGYAHALKPAIAAQIAAPQDPEAHLTIGDRETLAAFWLTLDAVNFGSGWFPTLDKRPGRSGYFTIAIGLRERFASHGPWSQSELRQITAAEVAGTLEQTADHPLMELFARSLSDLGAHTAAGFAVTVDAAGGSAVALAQTLGSWRCFEDACAYDELTVPFLKRAQIAAADLHGAGVARFGDLRRLTMFADNLVPHVLRSDGLLSYDDRLANAIERGALLAHGSREEVEIRAAAVHTVELIAAEIAATPAAIDSTLWNRGQQPSYKATPGHRCRCTAY
jgi:hypothetical protein